MGSFKKKSTQWSNVVEFCWMLLDSVVEFWAQMLLWLHVVYILFTSSRYTITCNNPLHINIMTQSTTLGENSLFDVVYVETTFIIPCVPLDPCSFSRSCLPPISSRGGNAMFCTCHGFQVDPLLHTTPFGGFLAYLDL